jgi:hypothetical protein
VTHLTDFSKLCPNCVGFKNAAETVRVLPTHFNSSEHTQPSTMSSPHTTEELALAEVVDLAVS